MFIHVSPTLSPWALCRAIASGQAASSESIRYFSYARGALITALHSIKEEAGLPSFPKVWLPAFVCDTVIVLLQAYAIEYRLYHITEDLEPDWKALEAEDVQAGDVFMLVHFFGFPMSVDPAVEFCARKRLLLLEDCAHSIVKTVSSGGIGTHGVGAVFGVRKILPVPNGGFLYMKSIPIRMPPSAPEGSSVYRGVARMAVQWGLQRLGIGWHGLKGSQSPPPPPPPPAPSDYYFNYLEGMSGWSARILRSTDVDDIVESRRRNFQRLVDVLREIPSIRIPRTLNLSHPQTVPWVLFCYHPRAHEVRARLVQAGISASSFPTLHADIAGQSAWRFENDLLHRSLTLPVHQDIGSRQMAHLISQVRRHADALGSA